MYTHVYLCDWQNIPSCFQMFSWKNLDFYDDLLSHVKGARKEGFKDI